MYNMLLVSTDSGFLVLSQKFIPFEDPSIKREFGTPILI